MLLIFHLVFLKFIKSSVPYFPMVCDLFALFCYSHFFCGLFTFFNLFLYFRKHCPLRKVFTLYFLMIGIFFTPIFCQNISGMETSISLVWSFPWFDRNRDSFGKHFYESLYNRNNHAKHNFGSMQYAILGVCRVFHKFYEKIDQNFFNFKKINTSIIFSNNKEFMEINTRKILKWSWFTKINTRKIYFFNWKLVPLS